MRLLTRSTARPFPVTTDEDARFTPRVAAIRLLREKIEVGDAGLDQYMPSDFIIEAGPNEVVWVNRCASLCGAVLTRTRQFGGGERFRVVLEADVRMELGLDDRNAALKADEPLASRGVDGSYDFASYGVAAAIAALTKTDDEPVSLAALREAKAAYDRVYPHGVEPQLVIRTDTDGAA